MLALFSSSHTLQKDLEQLLMFYDHFFVEFLCVQEHHHQHPGLHLDLHQQMGLFGEKFKKNI